MIHDPRPIALVGLSGAGKSAVARVLGARLAAPVADLDADIEASAGEPVSALFARHGEAWFRERERAALTAALASARVIACGGGIVLAPGAGEELARCRVVWLEVAPEVAARRLAPALETRPLLAGGDAAGRLAALLAARAPLYAALAPVRVDTDGRTPAQVAGAVLAALGEERP